MNTTQTRKCRKCQEVYEPEYYDVLGLHLLNGDGFCKPCAQLEYDADEAREKATQIAEATTTRRMHRKASGIPSKFMNEDFSTFKKGWQDKAYQTAVAYAESFPVDQRPVGYRSLYLWSDTSWGTGKTHLACAIAHRIFDRGNGEGDKGCPRIYFLSEPELFRQIQATYSFNSEEKQLRESEDDIIKRLIWADLVVLDDVGKEKRKELDFLQRITFGIIDGRYKNNLPLILTANIKPEELKAHWGGATYDRFWEQVKGKAIHMNCRSFRRK